jgi:SAM-dependent methyltransferase
VIFESAPFRARPDHLALIQKAAQVIQPDAVQLSEWFARYSTRHANRLATDLLFVQQYAKVDARIIEFGSTPLLLTLPLKWLGYDVVGIDLNPSRFQSAIAKHELSIIRCNVEQELLPLDTHSYDVAIFNELFEHLRINPIVTFAELRRILKIGGRLLMSTPNLRSLRGLVNILVRNRSYALCGDIYHEYQKLELHGHMGHVREYTTADVRAFLAQVGFEVEKIIYREVSKDVGLPFALLRMFPRLRPFVTYVARSL